MDFKSLSPLAVHEANPFLADFQLLRDDFLEKVYGNITIDAHNEGSAREKDL